MIQIKQGFPGAGMSYSSLAVVPALAPNSAQSGEGANLPLIEASYLLVINRNPVWWMLEISTYGELVQEYGPYKTSQEAVNQMMNLERVTR